jgi:hypothetical protein
MERKWE